MRRTVINNMDKEIIYRSMAGAAVIGFGVGKNLFGDNPLGVGLIVVAFILVGGLYDLAAYTIKSKLGVELPPSEDDK